jgi:hypothetical protein
MSLKRIKERRRLGDELFGGACQRCGYNRCKRALQFHHKDNSEKRLWSGKRADASPDEIEAHPERFELLCANCHFEEHDAQDEENRVYGICERCGAKIRTADNRIKNGRGRHCSRRCRHLQRTESAAKKTDDRFWKHVRKSESCWRWTGYEVAGMGIFNACILNAELSVRFADRHSYELANGPIPEGKDVYQSCLNSGCVNPAHLYLDGDEGRIAKHITSGMNPICKQGNKLRLSQEQMDEIRERYLNGSANQATLSREFGVGQSTISNIVHRKVGIR